jgi:hypothetical protein
MHIAVIALLATGGLPGQSWNWRFDVGETPEVNISNVHGAVTVAAGSGEKVTIEAAMAARKDSQASWTVEAKGGGDRVHVEVCCGPCEQKRKDCSDPPDVKLVLTVPERASVEISSVSASVTVARAQGAAEISTVSGQVDLVGTASVVNVSSVSGAVRIAPSALDRTTISTVSGDVKLQLPPRPDARISFSAVGGKMDGKSVVLGSRSKKLGSGRHEIEVSTVSGGLSLEGGGS